MLPGWLMEDADPCRSRRIAARGPRRGRILWSLELGESIDEPVVLPGGTIVAPFSTWAKREGIVVIGADGTLKREIPSYRPDWSWRTPVAMPDGTLLALARNHVLEIPLDREPSLRGRLPAAPARIAGTPGHGLYMHTDRTGFTVMDREAKVLWTSATPRESAWREGTGAFDGGGVLYTAEHDTWRSADSEAEQFSRIGAHAPDGRLLWRHVLTAGNPSDSPENLVHAIWGREADAVYFGDPLIHCHGADGRERWRLDIRRDRPQTVAIGGESVVLVRDERLAAAPYAIRFTHGSRDYLACAVDAEGSTYLCDAPRVVALDARLGLRWQVALGHDYLRPPVLSPLGYLLVAGGKRLYAIGE